MDDAILTKGLDGTVWSWNPAAERLFGHAAEAMVGRSVFTLVPDERHAEERDLLARFGHGERVHHYETEMLACDGRRVLVSLTASPIISADGTVVGVAAIMRDVARDVRRRQESAQELQLTRDRLERQRGALATLSRTPDVESGDFAPVARAVTEAAGRTLGVARASVWLSTDARDAIRCVDLYEIGGLAEGERRHSDGITLSRAAYPTYFAAMEAERIVAAHCAQTDPRTEEFADGYLRPLGITAMLDAPVWADGLLAAVVCLEHTGSPREWTDDEQAFAGALADLVARALAAGARRRAEAALRQSEEQFRSMIENAADMITILSANGTITYESPSVERVLGYRPEALVGAPVFGFVHPDDLVRVGAAFQHVAAQPRATVAVEFRFRHADGSWRFVESHATNLLDHPAVGGIVANSRDVTERKAAAAQLAARTAELERSNRELEQFAYVASHDLQEPLRKIQAFGDRLVEECGPALAGPGETYLARMRDAARRMQVLITDLLSFSRIATKPQPFRPVDLGIVAADVLSDLEVGVQQAAACVVVNAPIIIMADPVQFRQLLQNLLGNALKFRREGVPSDITVRAKLVTCADGDGALLSGTMVDDAAQGEWCQLEIADNGIGFDEKYLDRIFNPFQRLHGRGSYEGTGMGLAICRKIVERHGGRITATSEIGVGTTFHVLLPARPAVAALVDAPTDTARS